MTLWCKLSSNFDPGFSIYATVSQVKALALVARCVSSWLNRHTKLLGIDLVGENQFGTLAD